jgi:calcineurin-like phosphoesterase family protein
VTTLVVSDLHLGMASGRDLLRRPAPRLRLLAELEQVDRVVLLGDVLELREAPVPRVLEAARPFLEELGRALAGRELVVVPGNHDHALAAPLVEERRLTPGFTALGLEETAPAAAGTLPGSLSGPLGGAQVRIAYPGVWLRPDVYATHGHYLDLHMTVPKLEALAASLSARLVAGRNARAAADGYEVVLAPLYSFAYGIAQARATPLRLGSGISLRIWSRLNDDRPQGAFGSLERALLKRLVLPSAVGGLNLAGLGPFRPDLSHEALHEAGLAAMRDVVRDLSVDAAHVVFGHTHRAGPLEGEEPWSAPGEASFHNTGCWVWEPALLAGSGPSSPYWPGTAVFVPDEGPPRLRRLLQELTPAELGAVSRSPSAG